MSEDGVAWGAFGADTGAGAAHPPATAVGLAASAVDRAAAGAAGPIQGATSAGIPAPKAVVKTPVSLATTVPETGSGNLWGAYRPAAGGSISPKGGGPSVQIGSCRRQWSRRGPQSFAFAKLEVIKWHGEDIVPVQKDFAYEHPAVAARSEEECEKIRAANSIHVVVNLTGEPLPKPICRFEEAPFPDWAAAELRQMGYERPTPIQVQAWPIVLKGFDFVGIAETGSGKTVAYVLPMLVHLMAQPELRPGEGPVGLVLVPTRDLCVQVAKQVENFVGATKVVCRAFFGGEDISQQSRELANRIDVAVATPGRLIALLNGRVTNLRRATFVVLDEADELLGRGFDGQVRLIMSQIRPDRQALLFSATWDKRVNNLAREVCHQRPIHVAVGSTKLSACRAITQHVRFVSDTENKFEQLCAALERIRQQLGGESGHRALVFCNARDSVEPLVEDLRRQGYPCIGFHGQQDQSIRDEVLRAFGSPSSGVWLLVCTQILGRGYDFQNVRYVINFDMPPRVVEYIHRIGRTGRAGQRGYSLTFFTHADRAVARDLAMVLRESGQPVPDWLSIEARKFKRFGYWRPGVAGGAQFEGHGGQGVPLHAPASLSASASALPPGAASASGWRGRGKGARREEFLARCCGRGAARAPASAGE